MEKKAISFAQLAKEESAKAPRSDAAKRALLSSFIRINGYLRLTKGEEGLELSSESASIAKAVYQYLHELYGVSPHFAYTRSAGFLKRVVYHVLVGKEAEDLLNDLQVDFFAPSFPKSLLSDNEALAGYLSGAFLAAGSVNDPVSSNYHLEIALQDESYAKSLMKVWNKAANHQFNSKLVSRRKEWVVYLKRSDEISDFLILIGAKEACLQFENVRVDRDFANIDNRLRNIDTANYQKTQKAAERQIMEIHYFVDKIGFDRIDNPKLKALMQLRLAHPDMSLDELRNALSEELNSAVSKSNVNHLFRYLDEEYRKAAEHERKKND
jgi:DNA-binding protein WhiA